MSKKIKISIPNKVRPNLVNLFREYIVRKGNEPQFLYGSDYYNEDMYEYWNRAFPGWDDDDMDDDDSSVVFPFNQSKRENSFVSAKGERKKKKHRSRSKNKRIRSLGSRAYRGIDEDDEYNFDDIDLDYTKDDDVKTSQHKEIWFYPDYHVKDDKLEFNTLKDFNDYCEDMGFYVPSEVEDTIIWQYESHCCIYPKSCSIGLMEVMCESTYGEMYFEACEEDEI